ncbi:MAG: BMC domain-containing protein [Mailhella sp.]|nr:BMC domain-containing protein [Mailhella sp.]
MLALGLVETCGLVGAIEAADVMLKSADVELLERNGADAGLVTITVAGEVSAVQASVQAAAMRVRQIAGAELLSAHVIPRPDLELEKILLLDPEKKPGPKGLPPAPPAAPQAPSDSGSGAAQERAAAEDAQPRQEQAAAPAAEEPAPAPQAPANGLTPARLRNMSLAKLRQTALEMEGHGLTAEAIASADRRTLIAALTQALK